MVHAFEILHRYFVDSIDYRYKISKKSDKICLPEIIFYLPPSNLRDVRHDVISHQKVILLDFLARSDVISGHPISFYGNPLHP